MAQTAVEGKELTELQNSELVSMDLHDDIFADIDLNWWIKNGH
jgi:hypothetical protein